MISFIIPTYDEEKYIAATLRSLRKYILTPYEIIVSDDCSTDQTREIARNYADSVVECDPQQKKTIAAARNRGAAHAKFPFIVFIDSTVHIPNINDFFHKMLNSFETNPKLVGTTTNVRIWPEVARFPDKLILEIVNFWYWLNNNIFSLGTAQGKFQMVRADSFRKIGGFDERLAAGEDVEMFSRLRKQGKTKFLTGLAVYHSGRRAHALGWARLLILWIVNATSTLLLKKSVSKVWRAIR